MEKVVRTFKSQAEADAADRDFYRSLTGDERVQIALEIIWKPYGDSPPKFERVMKKVRVVQDAKSHSSTGDEPQ